MTDYPANNSSPTLTDSLAAAVMERARKAACGLLDDRCLALPNGVEHSRCDRRGRCEVGWISANNGRDCWDVYVDLNTGEGRLRRWQKR